jgi:hypothetical protein
MSLLIQLLSIKKADLLRQIFYLIGQCGNLDGKVKCDTHEKKYGKDEKRRRW